MAETDGVNRSVRVRGIVQGVGFRPAVCRAARTLGLQGDVRNDGDGVLIHATGPAASVAALIAGLRRAPPPLARIASLDVSPLDVRPAAAGFSILDSTCGGAGSTATPDAATCAACAAEIADPADRRFRYPFPSCTACGPRFTILDAMPFDRARTTMARFPLCAACAAEYDDPADRRFHAEAIACPACGPPLAFGDRRGEAALQAAIALLAGGGILAVKGLGGYQLACDAADAAAVARLRERKRRATKPFAVMLRDLPAVRALCRVSAAKAALLASAVAPILLLLRRGGDGVAAGVAPGLDWLGVMLPTTPLHLLLLEPCAGRALLRSIG